VGVGFLSAGLGSWAEHEARSTEQTKDEQTS
jgi:hypothetical protein